MLVLGRKIAQRNAHHVGDVTEHPRSVEAPPCRACFRPDSAQALEYQATVTATHQGPDIHGCLPGSLTPALSRAGRSLRPPVVRSATRPASAAAALSGMRRCHEPQLVAIGVFDCHVAKPQVVVRNLGHNDSPLPELRVPCVRPSSLARPRVSAVRRDHEHWKRTTGVHVRSRADPWTASSG